MARETRTITLVVPVAAAIKILDRNDNRVQYSIQNLDAANFICIGSHPQIDCPAVGAETHNTGQRITFGQSVSDDIDLDEVWCIANTGAVNVAVVEMTMVQQPPRGTRLRPARSARTQLRRGTRSFG